LFFDPVELVEHVRQIFGGDADARVRHADRHPLAAGGAGRERRRDRHAPAGRCVLDAVVEEVDHLSDAALDRRNGRRLRELGVELDVLRSPSVWKK